MKTGPHRIELTEWELSEFPEDELSEAVGEQIWREHRKDIEVEFPTVKTGRQWWLRPGNRVGYIPLTRELGISIRPKVPVANVFRMLEYAYRLDPTWMEGLVGTESLPEFYERLAHILARRVLDRSRRGLYRTYAGRREDLPYVRGRLELRERIRKPWRVHLPCDFEEHTADVDENRILSYTLHRIARSGSCTERVLPTVRRAFRAVRGFADSMPFYGNECTGRLYNRLNDDYRPMHALCRFFLDHSGPSLDYGEREMLPFLVDMAQLFEKFVAEWLRAHVPAGVRVETQKHVPLGRGDVMEFVLDLVLRDLRTGQSICVIDTKYKAVDSPSNSDVYQVVTYAVAEGCDRAFLVYPVMPKQPLNDRVRDVRVQTLAFPLDGHLDGAGGALVPRLLGVHRG